MYGTSKFFMLDKRYFLLPSRIRTKSGFNDFMDLDPYQD
jgi:hypothetical protein